MMPKPQGDVVREEGAARVSQRMEAVGGWRGATLAHIRRLIHEADPEVEEDLKWVKPTSPGTPVWSHEGILCTGESHKQVVKLTFARGASLPDPAKLFNASLDGNVRRAIDLREGETIAEAAFQELIRTAVGANAAAVAQRTVEKR